ncbi:rhomboid protease ROM9 [Plasmodium gonderi]|uniref:Rhomboid protease ROM9 n=1 Tax=Plasmodium gonderi TaxID=77519 RepID=A0A1Y1JFX2_PLAGO|nr:rhomboid protease ROM9 [Plasmodium gonderi]GAW81406.1 rhomboid protease ROM9 [Plasmodium gonderi]
MRNAGRQLASCNYGGRNFSRYSEKQVNMEKKKSKKIESLLASLRNKSLRNPFSKLNKITMQNISNGEKKFENTMNNTYKELCKMCGDLKMKYQDQLYIWKRKKSKLRNKFSFFSNLTNITNLSLVKNILRDTEKYRFLMHNFSVRGKAYLRGMMLSHCKHTNISYYKSLIKYHYYKAPVTYTLMTLHVLVYLLWINAKPTYVYDNIGMPKGFFYYPTSNSFFSRNKNFLTQEFMYSHFCCGSQHLKERKLYTLVTNLISHNSIQSLLLNTISLYYIGRSLEIILNSKNFFLTYIISGIISSYIQICSHKNNTSSISPYNNIYVLGASGSISSILTTYTFMHPNSSIYFYGVFPLPLAMFTSLYFINEMYCVLMNKQDNTGHVAHLTGMLLGILYYYFYVNRRIVT